MLNRLAKYINKITKDVNSATNVVISSFLCNLFVVLFLLWIPSFIWSLDMEGYCAMSIIFLILAGSIFNNITVIANRGKMPVLGLSKASKTHKPLNYNTKLIFLCDIFPFYRYTFSAGDILIFLSVIVGFVQLVKEYKEMFKF